MPNCLHCSKEIAENTTHIPTPEQGVCDVVGTLYYDVSYHMEMTGAVRVGPVCSEDEAVTKFGEIPSSSLLSPLYVDIKITEMEEADLSIEDPQSATGNSPRPYIFKSSES